MNHSIRLSLLLLSGLGLATAALAHDGDPKLLSKKPMYPGTGWRNAQLQSTGSGPSTLLGPAVDFPHSGVTLLSWLSLPDFGVPAGGNGNSCFGYVSPSGREYAIIGLSTGTAFVEVTQPGNPVIVAQIAGPQSLWRDVRTYSNYCYAISEGGGGIQVMSLANIDSGSVSLVNTINDDATSATHTLTIDPVSGYLYRSGGSSNGLRIYNLNPNPAAPARVGTWNPRYVHEPSVFTYTTGPAAGKQIAYCCGGLNGGFNSTGLYVVDVTNKAAPVQLSFLAYPNAGYCHQAWPSPDMHYLYLDDELDDQNLGITSTVRVFDISNPLAVTYVGTFTNGNSSIDHNLYTKNDLIYQAAYRSGLRIYKTSAPGTPTVPVEVAYFDTWPEDDIAEFNGLWNNYPYLPSGIVIGSDIEKGLFVWWVGTPQITFTIPGGAPALVSPAGQALAVQIAGSIVPGTEQLHVNTGAGFVTSNLVALGGGNYQAQLPAAPCGSTVAYYVSAQSPNGIVWTGPEGATGGGTYEATAAFAVTTVANETFELTAGGFVAGAVGDTATTGIWTRVNPNGTAAQPEDDHTAGAGVQCWVTGQGTAGGSVGAADVDGGTTTLLSPVIDMSTLSAPTVSYWRWYSNNQGVQDDTFRVDISNNNGASWVNVETLGPAGNDVIGGWIFHSFPVSSFVTPTSQVKLRFVADDSGQGSVVEAAIDDFQVTSVQCSGMASFCAGDGSQTPCPCANNGTSGRGCANSGFASGALLGGAGTASVLNDSVVLSASEMTGSTAIFFQGTTSFAPTIVDDGLGCIGGSIVRLGTKIVNSGAATYPEGGDASISVRGSLPPAGGTYFYQCFYRNAAAAFCPPATSNRTNGMVVTWAP